VSGVMVAEVWKRCIPQAKVLFLIALAEESNDLGHVFINPNHLAWKLSLNIRSVQRLIIDCTESGYLVQVDASHRRHEGPYNLQLEQVELKPAYGQKKDPKPIPTTTEAPSYPDWWAPLTKLKGYRKVNNASRIAVITAACASHHVEPSELAQSFAAYWPVGQIKHQWSDPIAALNRTIEIQISKVKNNAVLSRDTTEHFESEKRTADWAERANDQYSPTTTDL